MAWLLNMVQNGDNDVRILGFFRDEFHKENPQLEAKPSVSGCERSARFLVALTKNISFWTDLF